MAASDPKHLMNLGVIMDVIVDAGQEPFQPLRSNRTSNRAAGSGASAVRSGPR
jgi:hypothetical protein